MAVHVFKDGDHRAKGCNGVADVGPKVSLIVFPFPGAGVTEGLARIAARENVDRRNVVPIYCFDVAKVWHAYIVRCQNCVGVLVDLGIPRELAAIEILHSHI